MGSGLAGRPGLHPRRSGLGGGQGTAARVGVTKQVNADRGSIVSFPRFGLHTNCEPDPFLQRQVSSRGPWSCRRDKVEAPITVNRTTGTPTGETAPVTNGPRPSLNGISGTAIRGVAIEQSEDLRVRHPVNQLLRGVMRVALPMAVP